jgi:hypothetical protein
MKPIFKPLVWIVLVAEVAFAKNASAAPADCGRIEVHAQVEVPPGEVTLANILDAGTCSAAVRAATRIRLGAAPLAGSPRVLRGDEVQALVERLESADHFESFSTRIPERVTIRRIEPRIDCSNLTAHLAVTSSDGVRKNQRACATRLALHPARSGNPSSNGNLVRRGERVILEWDSSGIRITLPAVSLDGGAFGEQVRVRIEPGGLTMDAVVVDRGQLRAGSSAFAPKG